jgi:hypothetical protein
MATARIRPRFHEPEPTEEDRQRMRERELQYEEEMRLAREAGEKLPPLNGVELWGNPE